MSNKTFAKTCLRISTLCCFATLIFLLGTGCDSFSKESQPHAVSKDPENQIRPKKVTPDQQVEKTGGPKKDILEQPPIQPKKDALKRTSKKPVQPEKDISEQPSEKKTTQLKKDTSDQYSEKSTQTEKDSFVQPPKKPTKDTNDGDTKKPNQSSTIPPKVVVPIKPVVKPFDGEWKVEKLKCLINNSDLLITDIAGRPEHKLVINGERGEFKTKDSASNSFYYPFKKEEDAGSPYFTLLLEGKAKEMRNGVERELVAEQGDNLMQGRYKFSSDNNLLEITINDGIFLFVGLPKSLNDVDLKLIKATFASENNKLVDQFIENCSNSTDPDKALGYPFMVLSLRK